MPRQTEKPLEAKSPTGDDGRLHDRVVIGYVVALFAAIVTALLLGYKADIIALVGCALGGLMHVTLWPSDE